MTVHGSVDINAFLTYVTQVLTPQLWTGAIVLMNIIKGASLKLHSYAVIAAVGAQVFFLPLYSRLFISN